MPNAKKNDVSVYDDNHPEIAHLYARWTLDNVIEFAHAVAIDFTKRPRQYKSVTASVATAVEGLWYRYGTDPDFPDPAQRKLICEPLIGGSDGRQGAKSSQFHTIAGSLRKRAWDFSNRQVQTGENNLRAAFLDDAITFRSYLETLQDNAVVRNGNRQVSRAFDLCIGILTDRAIAGVFGRPPSEAKSWPLGESFDENGARLIEEISMALQPEAGKVSQSEFVVCQRIAHYGASTIAGVLSYELSPSRLEAIDPLISQAYRWKTAIDAFGK
jgi:hypothetical protein